MNSEECTNAEGEAKEKHTPSPGTLTDNPQTLPSISDSLKWLGDRRDGFLIAGAGIYGLGYAVWSRNAYRSGLGQLPGLDLQYFTAGLVPAALLILTWALIARLSRIENWLIALYERSKAFFSGFFIVMACSELVFRRH
jgi:hypothetical protein